jgi:hypothetical protein
MTSQDELASGLAADDLVKVSRTKVFFGHQSVGMNVLNGVPAVYSAHGAAAPAIREICALAGENGGFIGHAFIGENGNPLLKIRDFAVRLRSGVGRQAEVAMMKLCYADITADTDTGALFAAYREAIASLERDLPEVTFVHVTVPLMTVRGPLAMLKGLLTRSSRTGPPQNVARERLNDLIRREYAGSHLFDLAAVESTRPDGSRATSMYQGQQCRRLYGGYAADTGHLNAEGSRIAATAWLAAVAQASPK